MHIQLYEDTLVDAEPQLRQNFAVGMRLSSNEEGGKPLGCNLAGLWDRQELRPPRFAKACGATSLAMESAVRLPEKCRDEAEDAKFYITVSLTVYRLQLLDPSTR